MKKLYKVEELVKMVLTEHPDTRDDNFTLVYRVYKEINEEVVLRNLFFDVMLNYKEYGLVSFEGITRARRKIMQKHPELKPVKVIQKARKKQEAIYKDYALK